MNLTTLGWDGEWAYALADLYERAGEVQRARDLFERIQRADARFGDVGRRIKALK